MQGHNILLQRRSWEGKDYECLPADKMGELEFDIEQSVRRIINSLASVMSSNGHSHPILVQSTHTHPVTGAELTWDGKPAEFRIVFWMPDVIAPHEGSYLFDMRQANLRPDLTFELFELAKQRDHQLLCA